MNKKIKGLTTKRLNELKDEKKYFRNEDEILLEKTIIEKNYGYTNEYLIEVSTNHNSSNHKFLKIWKYYWTDEYGWQPLKDGIIIPIKDAKPIIKDLHEYFSS